jgi:uracil-DNA glycosylase family 4
MSNPEVFDIHCRACTRLAEFLDELTTKHPDYHNLPVAPFGDPEARLLIVGLAPGMHGANATGRPFTGDFAGVLLYQTLFKFGFANKVADTHIDDGLQLLNCRISNAVKCLPPQNKPTGQEINNCNHFLATELQTLADSSVIVALGGVAHRAVIKAFKLRQADFKFGHAAIHQIGNHTLIDSYHCSRYNTQTKRLTEVMFEQVFSLARDNLSS